MKSVFWNSEHIFPFYHRNTVQGINSSSPVYELLTNSTNEIKSNSPVPPKNHGLGNNISMQKLFKIPVKDITSFFLGERILASTFVGWWKWEKSLPDLRI